MTKISIIIRIALAVVLFFLGAYIYGKFITWYLINKQGFKFAAFSVSWQFRHILLFSLCLAFVPISSLFLGLKKSKNMLVASFILFLFLVIGIIVKKFLLLANIKDHSGLEYDIPLTQALPELHMSIALIIGFILLLVLRVKNILFKDESIHLEELRLDTK